MRDQGWINVFIAIALVGVVALGSMVRWDARDLRNWWCAERYKNDCLDNMKRIGTACEMYATDNAGRYPTSLGQLVPRHLDRLPLCPAADSDIYSRTYHSCSNPDAYTVTCKGGFHRYAGVPDELDYCRPVGLIEH